MSKICITCSQGRPLEDYWGHGTNCDGKQGECRFCMSERNRKWWSLNRSERTRQSNRVFKNTFRKKNPILATLAAVKNRAKTSSIEFSLVESDLSIPDKCPALGIPLSYGLGWGEGAGLDRRDRRASIDRIDNARGYVPDNIVVVSYRVNRLKSDATIDELRRIVEFYDNLDRERVGEGGVLPPIGAWLKEVSMPAMQSFEKKET